MDQASQLAKLAKLHDDGLLTEVEFVALKRRIINEGDDLNETNDQQIEMDHVAEFKSGLLSSHLGQSAAVSRLQYVGCEIPNLILFGLLWGIPAVIVIAFAGLK